MPAKEDLRPLCRKTTTANGTCFRVYKPSNWFSGQIIIPKTNRPCHVVQVSRYSWAAGRWELVGTTKECGLHEYAVLQEAFLDVVLMNWVRFEIPTRKRPPKLENPALF